MRNRRIAWLLVMGVAALFLAGCGGGSDKSAKESEAGLTCEGTALDSEPNLPEGFPEPGELTYVDESEQGPTQIVEGFYEGELKNAYEDYKGGFEGAGYTVLFSEMEDKDAEVSYKDAQGKTSGRVALKAGCDNGNLSVHITNRPA